MALTDTAVRNAKAKEKPYKLGDSGGLFVIVRPNGAKWWRLKYRFGGKEKQLSLGVYPDVSLHQARRRRDEHRQLLADGVNPSGHRNVTHAGTVDGTADSFEIVAREWLSRQLPSWSEGHARTVEYRLVAYVFPTLGTRSMTDIGPQDILAMLRSIQEAEKYETASRVLMVVRQVCVYAIATGRITHNIAASVRPALTQAPPSKQFAAATDPKEIGPLLRMIDGYSGSPIVLAALRLAPLVFTRPGELRHAKWADIDLDAAEWRFRVSKTQTDLIVPLSRQAVQILVNLRPYTAHQTEWVFPGARNNGRPMSENAVLAALRSLGITKDQATPHGFRATARTALQEQLGFPVHVIEMQLAHRVADALGTSYNRTSFLPERKKMMQAWSDYLDDLRTKSTA